MADVHDVEATSVAPAPGWYADPGGSGDLRWWDGAAWTTAVRALPVPDPEPYGGDPRFGGTGAPAMPTRTPAPTPAAADLRPRPARGVGLPRWALVTGAVVLVLVCMLAVKALAGGGSAAPPSQESVLGGGDARANVAAMEADLSSVATAEETEFTEHQVYVAAASSGGRLTVGSQAVPLSGIGATVTVALSPSRTAYCIVDRRTPLGGGAPQTVVYVSSAGGLQPRTVTACPATF